MTELQLGILGAGRIVTNHFVPALKKVKGVRLAAVASRDPERAKSLGADRIYSRYDEVISDPNINAIYVATHNGLHLAHAIAALDAGKHVLCEKPLGRTALECRRMINAANAADRILVEAFMYHSHPQIARAREIVASGKIGELKTVEASFSFNIKKPDDVRLVAEWGGGALLDVGCYCVNACRTFFGGRPLRATALGQFDPKSRVDFSIAGVLDFGRGRLGVISAGFDCGLRTRIGLSGTNGTLTLDRPFISWEKRPTLTVETETERFEESFEEINVFEREIESFRAAAQGEAPPHLGIEEGYENALVLDALMDSAKRRTALAVEDLNEDSSGRPTTRSR